jgi:DNA-directed RNA polymerase specialized sigma subunit
MDIEEIIDKSVERTVARLMSEGCLKLSKEPVAQKTINLLERYESFKLSDKPYTQKVMAQIDDALKMIQSDPYYRIIPMYYFEHKTVWDISGVYNVSEKTITRHRKRLIRQLSSVLFSDDVIQDILS